MSPGDTVCFSGGELTGTDVTMTKSGTTQAPIKLVSDGATVRSVQITADHVTLEGFTVANGDGVLLRGTGITAKNNTISNTVPQGNGDADGMRFFGNGHRITGNTCRNVDAQCLIATGDQSGNSGAPPGSPSITFVDNDCVNNGAQAINLRRWPGVRIRHNRFSGPNVTRAVLLIDGSTGAIVVDNTTTGRPTVDIDNSSRPGSHVDANNPG
ncbi:MAG: right-handed parallel beta-helix repeat-containing protein [Pseudonocardiaceae bacterium]